MKKNLFEISHDYVDLMNEIESVDGELTPELSERLVIHEKERDVKSIAYLEVIRKNEAFDLMIDNEIKRLQDLKKRNKTTIERLKTTLLGAVNLFGEYTVGTVTFKTRKSTGLVIENETLIPKDYQKTVVKTTVDKKKITDAIKNGTDVSGAYLEERKNLMIK